MSDPILTDHQKQVIRDSMVETSIKTLGIPYRLGAKLESLSANFTDGIDCSGEISLICRTVGLKMPEGSQSQFNFTVATETPKPGDLAFFGRGKDITQVYHVGMVFDDQQMIEARGHQEGSSFKTGEVILRPRLAWENFSSFVGYRSHPKLV